MRSVLVIALAACGRVGFDGASDSATASDARPDSFAAPCEGNDEDRDGWPDACDNCPVDANGNQADTSELAAGAAADGLGDACDPRANDPGDYVFLFDPFDVDLGIYTSVTSATYTGRGTLQLGELAGPGQLHFDTPLSVTRIDVLYEITQAQGNVVSWIGVWSQVSADDQEKVFSEAAVDSTVTDPWTYIRLKEQTMSAQRYSADIIQPSDWLIGPGYRIVTDTALATAGEYEMTVSVGAAVPQRTTLGVAIPVSDLALLEANRLVSEFHHLVVYAIR